MYLEEIQRTSPKNNKRLTLKRFDRLCEEKQVPGRCPTKPLMNMGGFGDGEGLQPSIIPQRVTLVALAWNAWDGWCSRVTAESLTRRSHNLCGTESFLMVFFTKTDTSLRRLNTAEGDGDGSEVSIVLTEGFYIRCGSWCNDLYDLSHFHTYA